LTYFKIWWRHWYSSIRWWHRDPSMCLFIRLMCSPSFTLGYEGWSFFYNSSFLFFFAGTRSPSSNQILSPFNKWIQPHVEKRNNNLHQLVPSPLISTNLFSLLHVLDPKEIPSRRNFGFLVSSIKIIPQKSF
jgi:hypothetical protein